MNRYYLTDDQWEIVQDFLRSHPRVYVGNSEHCLLFIHGVMWVLRSGSQCRSLPDHYGHWNSVFKRYDRRGEMGIWDDLFMLVTTDADLQEGHIGSKIVRSHACAAGAKSYAVSDVVVNKTCRVAKPLSITPAVYW